MIKKNKLYDEEGRVILETEYDDEEMDLMEYSFTGNFYKGDEIHTELCFYNSEDYFNGAYRKYYERSIFEGGEKVYSEVYICNRGVDFLVRYEKYPFVHDGKNYEYSSAFDGRPQFMIIDENGRKCNLDKEVLTELSNKINAMKMASNKLIEESPLTALCPELAHFVEMA